MDEHEKRTLIETLTEELNRASAAYYGGREEIMTNFEWDAKFDKLRQLELEIGYSLPDSPTRTVSYSADEGGQKEEHEFPALSLAKTKKVEDLQAWAGERTVWLSWKLDGLTLVLSYDEGKLSRILTRGDGRVGTNISYMKEAIKGFPLKIDYTGHLVVRGEAMISYPDFEHINAELEEGEDKFANPRNLASGTLALDVKNLDLVKKRRLSFRAFTLVYAEKAPVSWGDRMDWLDKLGFSTVEREKTDAAGLPELIDLWTKYVNDYPFPVDGLVLSYDDTEYAATGSVTGHHATRAGLAYKWQDHSAFTLLDHIEWSCAASTITPVAVFRPVQLEGTTVSRASLVNLSELERLGIGADGKTELEIIKSNKIIPKCVAVRRKEGTYSIPEHCPVCGERTEIYISDSGTKTLRCTNSACPAKHLKRFARFDSKEGLDIDGMSIETIRDFVAAGILHEFADLWHLSEHAGIIMEMEGFGEKSCTKLLTAVEKRRDVIPERLINALSIPQIGIDAARRIARDGGWAGFLRRAEGEGFADIDGIGPERSAAILAWMAENRSMLERLLAELRVQETETQQQTKQRCAGLTFVITGDVHRFRNRDEFKTYVLSQGGKVAGSVSGKTSYLVNNDPASGSSKNRKAREIGIPILSEEEFITRFGDESGGV